MSLHNLYIYNLFVVETSVSNLIGSSSHTYFLTILICPPESLFPFETVLSVILFPRICQLSMMQAANSSHTFTLLAYMPET